MVYIFYYYGIYFFVQENNSVHSIHLKSCVPLICTLIRKLIQTYKDTSEKPQTLILKLHKNDLQKCICDHIKILTKGLQLLLGL